MPLSALLLLPFAAISAANVPLFVSPTFRTPSNSTRIKALQSLTPPPVTCLTSPPLSLRWIRAKAKRLGGPRAARRQRRRHHRPAQDHQLRRRGRLHRGWQDAVQPERADRRRAGGLAVNTGAMGSRATEKVGRRQQGAGSTACPVAGDTAREPCVSSASKAVPVGRSKPAPQAQGKASS